MRRALGFLSSLPSADEASATAPLAVDFTFRMTLVAIEASLFGFLVLAGFAAAFAAPVLALEADSFAVFLEEEALAAGFADAVFDAGFFAAGAVDEAFFAGDAALAAGLGCFASFDLAAIAAPAPVFDSRALPDLADVFLAAPAFGDAVFAAMILAPPRGAVAARKQWVRLDSVPRKPFA